MMFIEELEGLKYKLVRIMHDISEIEDPRLDTVFMDLTGAVATAHLLIRRYGEGDIY